MGKHMKCPHCQGYATTTRLSWYCERCDSMGINPECSDEELDRYRRRMVRDAKDGDPDAPGALFSIDLLREEEGEFVRAMRNANARRLNGQ